ncbi:hypothetical protein [Archaeoglobus fulgidus]|uniref:hypothetical protein n=1 Tax=Archaeoglobus fulgidus TaxID=2234 RepID=UPI000B35B0BC|nr:hypothetical protein [Archaeoglobus fulgidus]
MNEITPLFDEEVIKFLVQTRNLLEEILETLDIMADKELMEAIFKSENEIRQGKTRNFKEILKELP